MVVALTASHAEPAIGTICTLVCELHEELWVPADELTTFNRRRVAEVG